MIKVFETFVGVGGWSFGLKRLRIPHEIVAYSEIDKYAIQCFEQNHCTVEIDSNGNQYEEMAPNLGDITKIDPNSVPDFDLLCASPPCQSFSIAGKGLGKDDVRGRLFENTIEIMRVKQPRWAIYENVKGLTFKKHKEYLDYILGLMIQAGYMVKYKVLNTKDYGIPQNRQRIFIICFKNKEDYESFDWPKTEELKIFIKDILEEKVDPKYYLSEKAIQGIMKSNYMERKPQEVNGVCDTLKVGGDIKCIKTVDFVHQIDKGVLRRGEWGNGVHETVSGTLNSSSGNDFVNVFQGDISNTLTTELAHSTGRDFFRSGQCEKIYNACGTFRRLTPKECFRLQGFIDGELDLSNLSDTQCYKLAGNGLSINVVTKIFEQMFKNTKIYKEENLN